MILRVISQANVISSLRDRDFQQRQCHCHEIVVVLQPDGQNGCGVIDQPIYIRAGKFFL